MDTTTLYDNNYKGSAANSGISGFWLKIIAVVTMLIDHVAASILARVLQSYNLGENWDTYYTIYRVMRNIGRMAFPIYIFLLIEGFTYTRSKTKYAVRMFIFAIISEMPFDMAFNNCFLEFYSNNVFVTLFLGLITIIILDALRQQPKILDASKSPIKWFIVKTVRCIGMAAIILGMMAIAEWLLNCDYGAAGIAAIVAMYLLKNFRMIGFVVCVGLLAMLSSSTEWWALLMLIPLYFYNGTRGKQLKYFFYAFYPVHLFIIAFVGYYMGLGI